MQNTRSKLRYLKNRFIRLFDNELIKERVPTYNTLIDGIFNIA